MSVLKQNPLVNLAKAAVGLSSGSRCSCSAPVVAGVIQQNSLPDEPSQAGSCECKEPADSDPLEQETSA